MHFGPNLFQIGSFLLQIECSVNAGGIIMKTRVAVISIIVEDTSSIEQLNSLLSEARDYIIGRMGIPYREKKLNLISIAIDAPEDIINTLSGKVGRLKGISAKTNYSNIISEA